MESSLIAENDHIDGRQRQIAGEERELARLNTRHELTGFIDAAERDGVAANLEYLRSELRAELGEPSPTHH
jgi:hypothetical protein